MTYSKVIFKKIGFAYFRFLTRNTDQILSLILASSIIIILNKLVLSVILKFLWKLYALSLEKITSTQSIIHDFRGFVNLSDAYPWILE